MGSSASRQPQQTLFPIAFLSPSPGQPSVSGPTTPSTTIPSTPKGGWGGTLMVVVGGLVLLGIGVLIFNYIQRSNGLPGFNLDFSGGAMGSPDIAPTPIDGKTRTVITPDQAPAGGSGDYGVQYWMYIHNWDYKFQQEKDVLKRISPDNPMTVGPRIFLSPAENTLNVRVSLFPTDERAGAAAPTSDSTGDSFTCSVENVPLQSWFAVSVTVFQRNLDIYINGRLVKSCILPGIPKPAVGDMILNDNGGFGGSICNVRYYPSMLSPEDARAFHAAGTSCAAPAGEVARVSEDSLFITLFGYTFRFSTLNKQGKELSSYTF